MPLNPNFFILTQFSYKKWSNIRLAPSPGVCAPLWEILDQPLTVADLDISPEGGLSEPTGLLVKLGICLVIQKKAMIMKKFWARNAGTSLAPPLRSPLTDTEF